jgi:predicted dehydrogenase
MANELRCCVIGCTGGWYQKVHHPSLQRLEGRVRLVAGTSRDPDRRNRITADLGFEKAYADIDEMLDAERPDFVFISVKHTETAGMACRVLERKIPVLMEKPVGSSPAEGRRVLEAARVAGVPNMVAFNRRHNPLLVRAKRLAAERGGVSQYVLTWQRHDVVAPHAMMGSTLHMIDTTRFLAGEVASFSGAGSATRYFDRAMVASSFHLSFEDGTVGTLAHNVRAGRACEVYQVLAENWSATVSVPPPGRFDTRWWMRVDDGDRVVEHMTVDRLPREQRNALYTQGFWRESEHFAECLEKGEEPTPTVADGVRSMELAQRLLEAVAPPEQQT